MINFLKRIFGIGRKASSISKNEAEPRLEFDRSDFPDENNKFHADADVHKLMVKATKLRKEEGYTSAIRFLQELAEYYRKEQNTAMVVCMNKLIPYMKRDESISIADTKEYLADFIKRVPDTNPYFLNLHITMADLLISTGLEKAIEYLSDFLKNKNVDINSYDHQLFLAGLYIEKGELDKAKRILESVSGIIKDIERTDHIKKERKWHATCAILNHNLEGDSSKVKYIFHRYMEFVLDMARVLDPIQLKHFQDRKDLYYNNKRGFSQEDKYLYAIQELGLNDKKDQLQRDIYGFCFEEMPEILGVSRKQFNYKPGESESLEELREKKLFHRKPFKELNILEDHVNQILKKYLQWTATDNC